ncbi:hypothetical protein PUNSTDRAFT_137558 [Punctularia strigosozonata HHB-11173 SS5]|uniref:uncharacterized protein n=1 Tax=Punctularia strigosozonata (strain HHB-11173) TaxID=741275 RepID=UPI0004416FB6|nr:uncharacterized protein PUNSTDRAFT_137558 [Punctularia strigosozonata HHB-11173 SS5]EIN05444.1 hypothetical protein PUNSTDRAFT_137558 [Punctularia strigosozonata HHB-11173 SS5]
MASSESAHRPIPTMNTSDNHTRVDYLEAPISPAMPWSYIPDAYCFFQAVNEVRQVSKLIDPSSGLSSFVELATIIVFLALDARNSLLKSRILENGQDDRYVYAHLIPEIMKMPDYQSWSLIGSPGARNCRDLACAVKTAHRILTDIYAGIRDWSRYLGHTGAPVNVGVPQTAFPPPSPSTEVREPGIINHPRVRRPKGLNRAPPLLKRAILGAATRQKPHKISTSEPVQAWSFPPLDTPTPLRIPSERKVVSVVSTVSDELPPGAYLLAEGSQPPSSSLGHPSLRGLLVENLRRVAPQTNREDLFPSAHQNSGASTRSDMS